MSKLLGAVSVLCGSVAILAGACGPAAAAMDLALGETFVYRVVNGYNKEVRGQLRYRVDKVDPSGATVSVTSDAPWASPERTEIFTKDGNWMRRLIDSHGQPLDYVFASVYPAYAFPLDPGKTWSVRVNAVSATPTPGPSGVRSVRVDGKVLGQERIRVPAGEFDTIKLRRIVYSGDSYYGALETMIVEYDWYAPALGRSVRTDSRSEYIDLTRCSSGSDGGGGHCVFYGDWHVFELVDQGRRP